MGADFEIYLSDLKPEVQNAFLERLGGDGGNFDIMPLAIFDESFFVQEKGAYDK